jgi:hypothetical protein
LNFEADSNSFDRRLHCSRAHRSASLSLPCSTPNGAARTPRPPTGFGPLPPPPPCRHVALLAPLLKCQPPHEPPFHCFSPPCEDPPCLSTAPSPPLDILFITGDRRTIAAPKSAPTPSSSPSLVRCLPTCQRTDSPCASLPLSPAVGPPDERPRPPEHPAADETPWRHLSSFASRRWPRTLSHHPSHHARHKALPH